MCMLLLTNKADGAMFNLPVHESTAHYQQPVTPINGLLICFQVLVCEHAKVVRTASSSV